MKKPIPSWGESAPVCPPKTGIPTKHFTRQSAEIERHKKVVCLLEQIAKQLDKLIESQERSA